MDRYKNPIMVALDVDSTGRALALADALHTRVGAFKVGMQLFYSAGPDCVRLLKERGTPVFVDLKLHDIPNTVAGAARALTRHGASIINVHAAGGRAMMRAAAGAAAEEAARLGVARPLVIAVTVLTSIDRDAFRNEMGLSGEIRERVAAWALMAKESGLDGVVASPLEIAAVREACGPDFVIVTPGIRPAGSAAGDQKRIMTPGEAVRQGATFLVIGRPVTAAPDPAAAAAEILQEINGEA
ncbi:MAG: orotidine-5'-phosphate decarboxylase [Peptococcaceae bacterium]|nr:orotidine-5'-phosphate decarboxylase [Peptococcaceae bacterium]